MATAESTKRIYEIAGRKAKVTALISAIDANARASRMDPLSREFVEELPRMDARWWGKAATAAKVHPPSETSIGEVIAFYRARVEQVRAQAVSP